MERIGKRTVPDLLQGAVLAALGLLLAWAGFQTRPAGHGEWTASMSSLENGAGFLSAVAGSVLLLWWIVGALCAVASTLLFRKGHAVAGRRTAAVAPPFMRRLAAAALGAGLLAQAAPAAYAADSPTGASVSASAVPGDTGPEAVPAAAADEPPTPLWRQADPLVPGGSTLLTRPGRGGAAGWGASAPGEASGEVRVAAGDSLWSLAARQLGPAADPAAIASQWPKWYELNRAVIGHDPNLLLPGQLLKVPPL